MSGRADVWQIEEPLPWHETVRQHVEKLLAEEHLPHALLLTGPPGWGELGLVNWIALRLLEKPANLDASTLAHPDIRWIAPDGAVTKIEAVREINEFAVGTCQIAPRKVVVIEAAHTLNQNAANALLKTLEEPPGETHLILATCHPGRLLATIRSRCQLFNVRPQAALARAWLEARVDVPDLAVRIFEYGNAPMYVLLGIQSGETSLESLLGEIARSPNPAHFAQRLLDMDPVSVTGRWWRYVQAVAAGKLQLPGLENAAPKMLMKFVDELLAVRRQLETSNSANPRLLLERLLVHWQSLGKSS